MRIERLGPGDDARVIEAEALFDSAAIPSVTADFLARPDHYLFVAYEGGRPPASQAVARMLGINPDEMGWKPGEHLPQEMLDRTAAMAKNFVMRPEDIADAVLYALCVPDNVQISEIMIRPLQPLHMPGLRLPA